MFVIQDFVERFNMNEIDHHNFYFDSYYDCLISFDSMDGILEVTFYTPTDDPNYVKMGNRKVSFHVDYRKYFVNVTTDEEALKAIKESIHSTLTTLYVGNVGL